MVNQIDDSNRKTKIEPELKGEKSEFISEWQNKYKSAVEEKVRKFQAKRKPKH